MALVHHLPLSTSHTHGSLAPSGTHALKFQCFEYKMEAESESTTSGDDSVFGVDSEVTVQGPNPEEEEEGEEHFR